MKGYLDQQVPFTFPQVSGGSGLGGLRAWVAVGWFGQGPRGHRLLPQQPPGQAVPCGGALLGVRKRPGEPGWPPVQDSEGTGAREMRGGMGMVEGLMGTVRDGTWTVEGEGWGPCGVG